MAVVFGFYDPDARRREEVARSLPSSLSGRVDRRWGRIDMGHTSVFVESGPSTPISEARDVRGAEPRHALVVGDYASSYQRQSAAAERLLRLAETPGAGVDAVSGQNGYYMAVLNENDQRLVLGTDTLGLFPLYVCHTRDVFLFGTSPELFRRHPAFAPHPSLYAIASILMFGHITSGRAIYEGVRRNTPGHLFEWAPGLPPRQKAANALRFSDSGFDRPLLETRDAANEILDRHFREIQQDGAMNLLLSGGADSRLVAAMAAAHRPQGMVQAVSLGSPSTSDVRCATRVARQLRLAHVLQASDDREAVTFASRQIALESLQGPLANFDAFSAPRAFIPGSAPVLNGYFGDRVLGNKGVMDAYDRRTGEFNASTCVHRMNDLGFRPKTAAALLRSPDAPTIIEQIHADLADAWRALDAHPFQKAWFFNLANRQRYYIASIHWRYALDAWPISPYIDRRLLDLAAGLPLHHLEGRRLQGDLIRARFPPLARLPLDSDGAIKYLTRPRFVVPALRDLPWATLSYRLDRRVRRHLPDRRYYYQTLSFNNPGWQRIRAHFDPARDHCGEFFDLTVLNRELPAAGTHFDDRQLAVNAFRPKILLGLVAWAAQRQEHLVLGQ